MTTRTLAPPRAAEPGDPAFGARTPDISLGEVAAFLGAVHLGGFTVAVRPASGVAVDSQL